jgi:uncharacterized DUF497 family protein
MNGIEFEWDRRRTLRIGESITLALQRLPLSSTTSFQLQSQIGMTATTSVGSLFGLSSRGNLLVVVHTIRGARIRLISARAATKHEKRSYKGDIL